MAAVETGKEVIWMKYFIGELGIREEEFRLHCDSQSAIHLAKNETYDAKKFMLEVAFVTPRF